MHMVLFISMLASTIIGILFSTLVYKADFFAQERQTMELIDIYINLTYWQLATQSFNQLLFCVIFN